MATMGLECVIISCGHGNHGNSAVSLMLINTPLSSNKSSLYLRGLLSVAMATIED